MCVREKERQRERHGLRECERHIDIVSEGDEGRRGFGDTTEYALLVWRMGKGVLDFFKNHCVIHVGVL